MNTIILNLREEDLASKKKIISHIRKALQGIGYNVPESETVSSRTVEKLKLTNENLKMILITEVK